MATNETLLGQTVQIPAENDTPWATTDVVLNRQIIDAINKTSDERLSSTSNDTAEGVISFALTPQIKDGSGDYVDVVNQTVVDTAVQELEAADATEATTRGTEDDEIRTIVGITGADETERRETGYNSSGLAGLNTGHAVTAANYTSAGAISAVRAAFDIFCPVGVIKAFDPHAPNFDSQTAYWQFTGVVAAADRPDDNAVYLSIYYSETNIPFADTYTGSATGGASDRADRTANHWANYYGWLRDESGDVYASRAVAPNGWYILKGAMWLPCLGTAPLPLTFDYSNIFTLTGTPAVSGVHDSGQSWSPRIIHDFTAGRIAAGHVVGGADRLLAGGSSMLNQKNLPFHNHYYRHKHTLLDEVVFVSGNPDDPGYYRSVSTTQGNESERRVKDTLAESMVNVIPVSTTIVRTGDGGGDIDYESSSTYTDDKGSDDFTPLDEREAVPIVPLQQQVQFFMRVQ